MSRHRSESDQQLTVADLLARYNRTDESPTVREVRVPESPRDASADLAEEIPRSPVHDDAVPSNDPDTVTPINPAAAADSNSPLSLSELFGGDPAALSDNGEEQSVSACDAQPVDTSASLGNDIDPNDDVDAHAQSTVSDTMTVWGTDVEQDDGDSEGEEEPPTVLQHDDVAGALGHSCDDQGNKEDGEISLGVLTDSAQEKDFPTDADNMGNDDGEITASSLAALPNPDEMDLSELLDEADAGEDVYRLPVQETIVVEEDIPPLVTTNPYVVALSTLVCPPLGVFAWAARADSINHFVRGDDKGMTRRARICTILCVLSFVVAVALITAAVSLWLLYPEQVHDFFSGFIV